MLGGGSKREGWHGNDEGGGEGRREVKKRGERGEGGRERREGNVEERKLGVGKGLRAVGVGIGG